MFQTALCGADIFTGDATLVGHALLLDGTQIVGMAPLQSLPRDARMQRLDGLLAPGFVDLQVNGGGGALFNADPSLDTLVAIAEAHAPFGTTALLPTFITDHRIGMRAAIDAIRAALAAGTPGIAGLHLEGPFIAPARCGAHDPALIRPMDEDDLTLILDSGIERLLLTVAPEVVGPAQVERLVQGGVVVSLGHSDADADTVEAAIDAGATGVTHLFNAMSPMAARAPGMVGIALSRGEIWAGLIADGHHVDPVVMRVALAAKQGPGRLLLVSDAMPLAGSDDDSFLLNGRRVTRGADGRLTLPDGTLAGSDLTMDRAVEHAITALGQPSEEALRMGSLYPARFMRMERTHGRLEAGRVADLVLLDSAAGGLRCWRGGVEWPQSPSASSAGAAGPTAIGSLPSAASSIARA